MNAVELSERIFAAIREYLERRDTPIPNFSKATAVGDLTFKGDDLALFMLDLVEKFNLDAESVELLDPDKVITVGDIIEQFSEIQMSQLIEDMRAVIEHEYVVPAINKQLLELGRQSSAKITPETIMAKLGLERKDWPKIMANARIGLPIDRQWDSLHPSQAVNVVSVKDIIDYFVEALSGQ